MSSFREESIKYNIGSHVLAELSKAVPEGVACSIEWPTGLNEITMLMYRGDIVEKGTIDVAGFVQANIKVADASPGCEMVIISKDDLVYDQDGKLSSTISEMVSRFEFRDKPKRAKLRDTDFPCCYTCTKGKWRRDGESWCEELDLRTNTTHLCNLYSSPNGDVVLTISGSSTTTGRL